MALVLREKAPLHNRALDSGRTPSSFYRRGYHTSVVANNRLYIDGGAVSSMKGGTVTINMSTALLSIDLTRDWQNSTVVMRSVSKPPGVPIVHQPSLWYHAEENSLYSGFSGWTSSAAYAPPIPPLSIWKFVLDAVGGAKFEEVVPHSPTVFSNYGREVGAFEAFGVEQAFVFGGHATGGYQDFPSMMGFNMSSKQLTRFSGPWDGIGRAEFGTLTFIKYFGPQGILIAMGGRDNKNSWSVIDFNFVSVFDLSKQVWYNQSTIGEAPSARMEHCAAGVASTDETFEIFIYAGHNAKLGKETKDYDTVHILTLPAFRWIRVPYEPKRTRSAHSCNAAGGSQIVIVGGLDQNPKITSGRGGDKLQSKFNSSADPFSQGLAIFDMTKLAWSDRYVANQNSYQQSDLIKQVYSPNISSNRNYLNKDIKALMDVTNFSPNRSSKTQSPTGRNPTQSPLATPLTPNSNDSSGSPHGSKAGIAGGVVAGVAGAILLALLGYAYFRRHHHRLRKKPKDNNSNSNTDVSETPFDDIYDAYAGSETSEVSAGSTPQLASGTISPRELWTEQSNRHEGPGTEILEMAVD